MSSNVSQLEKKIKYKFKQKDLLVQAITHSSYAYESQPSEVIDNEVLEFLGDSVLGLIIAGHIYSSYPKLTEGELSKLKSAAASTSALTHFAKKIKLDKNILLGKGEEKSGGRKKRTILAGAFEAVVAAIYLDGGLEEARKFLLKFLKPYFKEIKVKKFQVDNYKSALQEFLQKENLPTPVYKIVTEKGPDHRKSFVVEVISEKKSLAKAKGYSKKNAEQRAAQKALKTLLGKRIKAMSSDTFLLKRKKR
ncbi:MAG: ribonuclease III [Candidatus Aminicenantes bacterium]|nr:ribonuclease III [Candidatus Aminicenantes bacterium]